MSEINKACSSCGNNLVEIDWNTNYYLHMCVTLGCPWYRQPQGGRKKEMPWIDDIKRGEQQEIDKFMKEKHSVKGQGG
jgi:hypothetical protein